MKKFLESQKHSLWCPYLNLIQPSLRPSVAVGSPSDGERGSRLTLRVSPLYSDSSLRENVGPPTFYRGIAYECTTTTSTADLVFIGSIKHQVIKHKQTAPYVLLSANLDQLGRCIAFEDMKDLRTAGSFGSVQATTGEEEKRDGEDTCQQDHGQEGENQFRLEKHFHQCSPSGMFVGYSPTTPGEKTPTTKPKYEMGLLDDELITVRSNSFPNAFQKPKATRGCAERSLGT